MKNKRTLLVIAIASLVMLMVSTTTGAAGIQKLVINDMLVRKASWQLGAISATREFMPDGSMKISGVEGANYFKAVKYKNFEMHTRAQFTFNKENWNWAGYALRTKYSTVMPSDATNSGYMIIMSFQNIVVHKYDRGDNTILQTIPTDYFYDGKVKDIYIGIEDVAEGVRIYFIVDDSMIIDLVDTNKPLKEEGYFGTLAYLNSTHLVMPIKGYVSKVKPEEESLTDNPSAGEGPLVACIILAVMSVIVYVIPKKKREKFDKAMT